MPGTHNRETPDPEDQDASSLLSSRFLRTVLDRAYCPVEHGDLPRPARLNWSQAMADQAARRLPGPRGARSLFSSFHARRRLILAVACLIVLGGGTAWAATSILNLGKPTTTLSTSSYFPLSGFHHVPDSLRQGGKPEVLFFGVQSPYADRVAEERWPLVKALSQFGRFSGLTNIDSNCHGTVSHPEGCTIPTFDLSHARLSSPYITFVSKDLIRTIGVQSSRLQPLNKTEDRIFNRYVKPHGKIRCFRLDSHGNPIRGPSGQFETRRCTGFVNEVGAAVASAGQRSLPLLLVGHYLETVSQDIVPGNFSTANHVYSFREVQSALQRARDPGPDTHLVEDVNAEANIITALVCHADGMKPRSVCGRTTIGKILSHVR